MFRKLARIPDFEDRKWPEWCALMDRYVWFRLERSQYSDYGGFPTWAYCAFDDDGRITRSNLPAMCRSARNDLFRKARYEDALWAVVAFLERGYGISVDKAWVRGAEEEGELSVFRRFSQPTAVTASITEAMLYAPWDNSILNAFIQGPPKKK